MKVLVLGGTLFIGPQVVRRLVREGCEVTVFHRGKSNAELPDTVEHLLGDRNELRSHADTLRAVVPDVVLDMRPLDDTDAEAVLDVFVGYARRVVAISSVDVYRAYGKLLGNEKGPPDPVPLTEDSPLRERLYPYRGETPRAADDPRRRLDDYDKILAEKVFLSDDRLPGTVLRLPMVYGPLDYQHRLYPYLKRMDDGRPAILLDEAQYRWRDSHAYVGNVGHAISLAVLRDEAAGRVYNVAEPEPYTEAEWVRRVGRAVGWKGEVVAVPAGRLGEEGDFTHHLAVDSGRIRTELAYTEEVPEDRALAETIEWERANPPEPRPEFDYAEEDRILTELRG
ncbi:MAG: NAD-dependent epimerase/dehydratase family protein [Fimbriimonadia bacterium]|jgi:nucleoside-diphosphate-sugar epimerase